MKQESNPIDTFYREAPAVAKAFDGLVEALKDTKGLDSKTKQLVYIGIKAALGDTTAIHFHVLITLTVCGLKA